MTLGDLLNSGRGLNGVILLQKQSTNRASAFRRTVTERQSIGKAGPTDQTNGDPSSAHLGPLPPVAKPPVAVGWAPP